MLFLSEPCTVLILRPFKSTLLRRYISHRCGRWKPAGLHYWSDLHLEDWLPMRNVPRPVRKHGHRLPTRHQYRQYSRQYSRQQNNRPDLLQSELFKCAAISCVRVVTASITCNLARPVPDLARPIKSSGIHKGVAIILRKSLPRKSPISFRNPAR